MKYEVNYIDSTTGAISAIDLVEAPKGYTAEQYIADCDANADAEWCEMLHKGEVVLYVVED